MSFLDVGHQLQVRSWHFPVAELKKSPGLSSRWEPLLVPRFYFQINLNPMGAIVYHTDGTISLAHSSLPCYP